MTREIHSPWARPRNGIESMARYQAFYGFKPIGPHTALVARLLGNAFRPCAACEGSGLFGTFGGMGWRACPACRGFGQVWTIGPEELQARRRRVLEAFPDAGAAAPERGRAPILSLKTGEVVSAPSPDSREPVQGELPFADLEDVAALARRRGLAPPEPAAVRTGLRALLGRLWRAGRGRAQTAASGSNGQRESRKEASK